MTPILLAQVLLGLLVVLRVALVLLGRLKGKHSALKWTLASVLAGVALTLLIGPCVVSPRPLDGPRGVVFDNRLDQELSVYVDGQFEVVLDASKPTSVSMLVLGADVVQRLEARTAGGVVVYQQDISGRILDAQGWRIVITAEGPTPIPGG